MKINLNSIPISDKIKIFNQLYEDISGKGIGGDTELAHVNKYEACVLRALGGSGTINPSTNLTQYVGGGGSSGGGSGGGGQNTTSTVQKNEIPEYFKPYALEMVETASQVYDQPYEAYEGQRLADVAPAQAAAYTGLEQFYSEVDPTTGERVYSNPTEAGYETATDLTATGAQQFGDMEAGQFQEKYMSPYQQAVTDVALAEAQRQGDIQQQQLEGQAGMAGAYGGSRQAVLEAEHQRNLNRQLTDIQAAGSQKAFEAGTTALDTDRAMALAAGKQFGALAPAAASSNLTGLGALQTLGETQRGIAQQPLDINYEEFVRQRDYPAKQTQEYSGIIQGFPMQPSTYTTAQEFQQPPSLGSQLLSAGALYSGIQSGLGKGFFGGPGASGGLVGLARGGEVLDEEVIEEVTDINQTPLPMGIGAWMESDLLSKDQKKDIYKNVDIPVNSVGLELTPTERRIAEIEQDDDPVGFAFGGLSSIAELLKEDQKQDDARESRIIKALRAASPKSRKRSGKAGATAKRNYFQKLREEELKRAKESGGLEYLTGSSLGEVPDEDRFVNRLMANRAAQQRYTNPQNQPYTDLSSLAANGGLMSLSNGGPIRFQNEGAVPPVIEEVPMTAAERMMASGRDALSMGVAGKVFTPNYKTIEQATGPTEPEPVVVPEPVEVEPPPPPAPPVDILKNVKALEAHLYGDGMGRRGAAEEQTGFDMEKAMPWFAMAARLQTPGQSTGEAVTAAISDYTSLTNAAREAARDDREEEADALQARANSIYYYAKAMEEMNPSGSGRTVPQITGSYMNQISIANTDIAETRTDLRAAREDSNGPLVDKLRRQLRVQQQHRRMIDVEFGKTSRLLDLPDVPFRPLYEQPPTE